MITAKRQCISCGLDWLEFDIELYARAPDMGCLCKRCYVIIMASNDEEAKEALRQGRELDYERAMELVD